MARKCLDPSIELEHNLSLVDGDGFIPTATAQAAVDVLAQTDPVFGCHLQILPCRYANDIGNRGNTRCAGSHRLLAQCHTEILSGLAWRDPDNDVRQQGTVRR